jgi:hypothetical protein
LFLQSFRRDPVAQRLCGSGDMEEDRLDPWEKQKFISERCRDRRHLTVSTEAPAQTKSQAGRINRNARVGDGRSFSMVWGIQFLSRRWHSVMHPFGRGVTWGPPGNGKSATIRVMAAHPHIQPYAPDLSDAEEEEQPRSPPIRKSRRKYPRAGDLEDLDRAFPTEGKRTQGRMVS